MISEFWKQLEGTFIEGKYILERCLSAENGKAVFLTELAGDKPRPAAIKVMRHDDGDQEARLTGWNTSSALSHPNLVDIFEVGQADVEGARVAYAVMEYAAADLDSVLRERPLSEPEAIDTLSSTLRALACLHSRGLVHGRIKPSNIMAVGETIKISSDRISRPGEPPDVALECAPPETAAEAISPAADVWSLGVTLFEMLTQRLPRIDLERGILEEEVSPQMPPRFLEIIRHCLRLRPEDRWAVAQIERAIVADGPAVSESAAMPPPAPLSEIQAPTRRSLRWIYAAALTCGLLVAILLLRKPVGPPVQAEITPAPRAAVAPPASIAPADQSRPRAAIKAPPSSPRVSGAANRESVAAEAPAPIAANSPATSDVSPSGAANGAERSVWRVVVYTYAGARDAGRKVQEINRAWPDLHAEVFSINGDNPPYLVTIGGRMAREEALQLQRKALAAGLPKDAYVQNYSH